MKSALFRFLWFFALAAVVSACSPPAPTELEVEVASTVQVARGSSGRIRVIVTGRRDPSRPVRVSVAHAPVGVTVDSILIPPASVAGELEMHAREDAEVGEHELTLAVTEGDRVEVKRLRVRVVDVPLPVVTEDASLVPLLASVPGIDGGPSRPLASLAVEGGAKLDFTLDEVLVVTNDRSALDALVRRWRGVVLRETDFSGMVAADRSGSPGPHFYLVRIDSSLAELRELPRNLRTLRGAGGFRLATSNGAATRLLAVVASEAAVHGMYVGLNFLSVPASIPDGYTREGGSPRPDYNRDAFTWSYMGSGGHFVQNIGVAQAWQRLYAANQFANPVGVMVIDGGFARSIASPDLPPVRSFGADEVPHPLCDTPERGACAWHATDVMSALAALPDNGVGVAGPAGPIARLAAVQVPRTTVRTNNLFVMIEDTINAIRNTLDFVQRSIDAVISTRPRIINISSSGSIPGEVGFITRPLAGLFSFLKYQLDILVFAAAGNDGHNVNATKCYGLGDTNACLGVVEESEVIYPCELDEVICVGGLEDNANVKAGGVGADSNWGSRQRFASGRAPEPGENINSVDIYGPYYVWTGPTPAEPSIHRVSGTSFASPFVAGVAALVWSADPTLRAADVQRLLFETAHRRHRVVGDHGGLVVNAFGAVEAALANVPVVELSAPLVVPLNRTVEVSASIAGSVGRADCCTVTWTPPPESSRDQGRVAVYRFTRPGVQTITVVTTDNHGRSARSSRSIDVRNDPPTVTSTSDRARFEYRNANVRFTMSAVDSNEGAGPAPGLLSCDRVRLELLDGASGLSLPAAGTAPHCAVNYVFPTIGTHTLRLLATDPQGARSVQDDFVDVTVAEPGATAGPPAAIDSLGPFRSVLNEFGLSITFTGRVAGPPTESYTYEWTTSWGNFGEWSSPTTARTVTHVGATDELMWRVGAGRCGNLRVRLTVRDHLGNSGISGSAALQIECPIR